MDCRFLDPPGAPATPAELVAQKARDLAERLGTEGIRFARLIECRHDDRFDVVVFDVEVELGQRRVHAIRPLERVAVCFAPADRDMPEILALRADFPRVPHLNVRAEEVPRSICLFEEHYRDLKSHWTSAMLVERVREWLRLTARGELHAEDQPLEPLLLTTEGTLILPHGLLTREFEQGKVPTSAGHSGGLVSLHVSTATIHRGKLVLSVDCADPTPGSPNGRSQPPFVAALVECQPRVHGPIWRTPRSLSDLHDLLREGGDDLLGHVRARLLEWKDSPGALDAQLILLLVIPKTRSIGTVTEATDVWAFVTKQNVRDLGIDVGRWDLIDHTVGILMTPPSSRTGAGIRVGLLNVVQTLSRRRAALFNGNVEPDDRRFAAVGCGALGSHVVVNAARAGFGRWTLIDSDLLLPHNLARHALTMGIGFAKAEALSAVADQLLDDASVMDALVVDVLDPGDDHAKLAECLKSADVILDMSASVTVGRHLSSVPEATGRRASLFLNPTGADLVLLVEDRERLTQLDELEMQYYRALIRSADLAGHLDIPGRRMRYGRTCRDVSVQLPQELVALHAAIGTRALRAAVQSERPGITVWRADPTTFAVTRHCVEPRGALRSSVGTWTIVTDEGLLEMLGRLRAEKLPSETGGILLGSFDVERNIVYVVDTIPSPPDSEEWPTLYIRGCKGLPAQVANAERATAGQLHYVGEWHSHSDGVGCRPSTDDAKVFGWLTERMDEHGFPSLMMIVGESGQASLFLGRMAAGEPPTSTLHAAAAGRS